MDIVLYVITGGHSEWYSEPLCTIFEIFESIMISNEFLKNEKGFVMVSVWIGDTRQNESRLEFIRAGDAVRTVVLAQWRAFLQVRSQFLWPQDRKIMLEGWQ